MKLEKIINIIGYLLLVPGPIVLFGCLGFMATNGFSEVHFELSVVGLFVTIIGLVMGNFKEEWIMEEDDGIC